MPTASSPTEPVRPRLVIDEQRAPRVQRCGRAVLQEWFRGPYRGSSLSCLFVGSPKQARTQSKSQGKSQTKTRTKSKAKARTKSNSKTKSKSKTKTRTKSTTKTKDQDKISPDLHVKRKLSPV